MKADRLASLNAEAEVGGGIERISKQHDSGKLTARERIDYLIDGTIDDSTFLTGLEYLVQNGIIDAGRYNSKILEN